MRIKLKGIEEENFNHYKKVGMLLAFPTCDWKCLKEQNLDIYICQNSHLNNELVQEYNYQDIWRIYRENIITESFIFGGLEPFRSFNEMSEFIKYIRIEKKCKDDIVIYTGYYPDEIKKQIKILQQFKNIIIKFGRYIPNSKSKYDIVLGINLISENQFAIKIS